MAYKCNFLKCAKCKQIIKNKQMNKKNPIKLYIIFFFFQSHNYPVKQQPNILFSVTLLTIDLMTIGFVLGDHLPKR